MESVTRDLSAAHDEGQVLGRRSEGFSGPVGPVEIARLEGSTVDVDTEMFVNAPCGEVIENHTKHVVGSHTRLAERDADVETVNNHVVQSSVVTASRGRPAMQVIRPQIGHKPG